MTQDALLPKIFGIGLPRTGTTSLDTALRHLKIRSVHTVIELYQNPQSQLLDRFQAFGDSPIPLLYPELDRRYPGSRFILTRRGLEPWLKSMEWMFTHGKVKWRWNYYIHAYHQEFFGTRVFDAAKLTEKYHAFHAQVDAYFRDRPQDLLVIDLDRGFDMARLCRFLGKPETDIAFPRSNQRDETTALRRFAYGVYEQFLTSPESERRVQGVLKVLTLGRFKP